jgi:hypothetical protein
MRTLKYFVSFFISPHSRTRRASESDPHFWILDEGETHTTSNNNMIHHDLSQIITTSLNQSVPVSLIDPTQRGIKASQIPASL